MKKIISIISLMMILSLIMAGCGSSSSQDEKTSSTVSQSSAKSNTGNAANTPASGGKPEMVKADLSGEVTSVSGNQISIKVVEMQEPGNNAPPANGDQKNSAPSSTQSSTSKPTTTQAQPSQPPVSGTKSDSTQNNNQAPQMTTKYSGETKTITVTDSVVITSMAAGDNGGQQKTIKVSDIKQGDIIQISYSDKDKGTVSKISVMSAMTKSTSTSK